MVYPSWMVCKDILAKKPLEMWCTTGPLVGQGLDPETSYGISHSFILLLP